MELKSHPKIVVLVKPQNPHVRNNSPSRKSRGYTRTGKSAGNACLQHAISVSHYRQQRSCGV